LGQLLYFYLLTRWRGISIVLGPPGQDNWNMMIKMKVKRALQNLTMILGLLNWHPIYNVILPVILCPFSIVASTNCLIHQFPEWTPKHLD